MYAQLALLLCILSGALGADEWPRVDTIVLERVSLPLQMQLDGTLHPHRQAELACEVGGTIAAKEVLIGQPVRRGDVLLRLDAQRFTLIQQMRSAELDAARSSALLAEQSWQRVRQLHANDTASDEELERATFEKASAAARVQAASAALSMAELDWENSALRAPFSGEIAAIYGEVGEAVAAGQPLVRLAATDTLLVRAAVSSAEVQWLRNGLSARVTPGDGSPPFQARLRSFARVADPQSRRYAIELQAVNDAPRAFGTLASIELTSGRILDGVLVSEDALRSFAGTTYAYVAEQREGTMHLRQHPVTIGRELSGGVFLVTDGLSAGQTVAAGGSLMADGLRVQPAARRQIAPSPTP